MRWKYRNTYKTIFWILTGLSIVVGTTWQLEAREHPLLVINEIQTASKHGLIDDDGDHVDWIELYNPGTRPVNLGNWTLTDDPQQLDRWQFPDIVLPEKSYLVVFASGKNRADIDKPLHTNFELKKSGEFLGLYSMLDDQLYPFAIALTPDLHSRFSYGLAKNLDEAGYFESPTPGQANDHEQHWQGALESVLFSVPRGFYETPFQVILTTETPEATIRYTLDGSTPTEAHGQLYNQPIVISKTTTLRAIALKPNFLSSPSNTHTYLFTEDIINQSTTPNGFPDHWGFYTEGRSAYGVKAGEPVLADYEMDPDIVNHAQYGPLVRQAFDKIPAISLITGIENLDIYANAAQRGRAWERPVSVEYLPNESGQTGFHLDAGIRIHGNIGRQPFMPKHSFRLFFREAYGNAKLEYPLFPDSPVTTFETLILRAGANESYAGYLTTNKERNQDLRLVTYSRDQWLRETQMAVSGDGVPGQFVHLFLNGVYWGLYNLVERPDADYSAEHFGGKASDWHAVNHNSPLSGVGTRFDYLHDLAAVGGGSLQVPEAYAEIEPYINVEQFSDYIILNWYAGTRDWGHHNWYAGVQNPNGKVQYYVWDGERSWNEGAELTLGADLERNEGPNRIKQLFWALLWNVDFKMTFADRIHKHLYNDGALTESAAKARWQQINEPLKTAIAAEAARWGDVRYDEPITPDDWERAYEDVLAQIDGNVDKFISIMRKKGIYPDIDPPTFNQHGGLIGDGFQVALNTLEGDIYFTTDGTDPRVKGSGNLPPEPIVYWTGQIAPTASLYTTPIPIEKTTHIKARTRTGEVWSALTEATFFKKEEAGLQINEIMYNPPGGNRYEFIELKNTSNIAVNLAQVSFEGIDFTFPSNTPPLAPNAIMVLVRDPVAFFERYPEVTVAGIYTGRLSNRGETLRLRDQQGQLLLTVTYNDEGQWPLSPDGHGDSLVRVQAEGYATEASAWRASKNTYGSPGIDEPK
ncbi:MAG: lamin tail domain-containing protein [Chloroflexota bacterium]